MGGEKGRETSFLSSPSQRPSRAFLFPLFPASLRDPSVRGLCGGEKVTPVNRPYCKGFFVFSEMI